MFLKINLLIIDILRWIIFIILKKGVKVYKLLISYLDVWF
jgi:hypothetical protein